MSKAPHAVPTATSKEELRESITTNGFCVYPSVVDDAAIEKLLAAFERAKDSPHARLHEGDTYALRNVLNAIPEVLDVATSEELLELIAVVLEAGKIPSADAELEGSTVPYKNKHSYKKHDL